MPVKATWEDEEKTIIRHTYSGEWDWDEFNASVSKIETMLDGIDYKVDFIAYLEDLALPKDALANYPKIAQAAPFTHLNADLLVVVTGAGRFAEAMAGVFGKVFKQSGGKFRIVPTLEEAYEAIAERQRFREMLE